MGIWSDLFGTTQSFFRLGFAGPRLKNSGGNLAIRNPADSADAEVTVSKISVSGNVVDINSDAAGAGADWKYTLQRPAAGMSAAVTLTLPVDDGSPSQVLSTDGSGNLSFISAASTAACDKKDSTGLAFGTASPVAMFTTGAADVITLIEVVIDTAFNGAPTLSIGITGTTSKYASSTDIDLTQPAGTIIALHPSVAAAGIENLIATYAAGGASAGAARIIVTYGTPT